MNPFTHFIAIDWSGAKTGYGHKLQIGLCKAGMAAPVLITMDQPWSRTAILNYLRTAIIPKHRALIGMDFSFAPPFADHHAYLPDTKTANSAKLFWDYVNAACDDADLGAASFIDQRHSTHFYLGKRSGKKAPLMRLRACEQSFNMQGGGKPSSIFDAVGAAQVAKASFAGMRFLHHIKNMVPIWPFDAKLPQGSIIVEIYCRAFIRHAGLRGLKIRSVDELNLALAALGSEPVRDLPGLTDDKTDALVSAAGLRYLASNKRYWQPSGLTQNIAQTEGWTFGII